MATNLFFFVHGHLRRGTAKRHRGADPTHLDVSKEGAGRGAITGLLPRGPHNVRDVLATHILKKTGFYEQASYAIQDTPDVVAKHYMITRGRHSSALQAQKIPFRRRQ